MRVVLYSFQTFELNDIKLIVDYIFNIVSVMLLDKRCLSIALSHISCFKRPSDAPLHTLSKLSDVPVGFVAPPYFEAVYCFICGRRRVAVARYRMICLVHVSYPMV